MKDLHKSSKKDFTYNQRKALKLAWKSGARCLADLTSEQRQILKIANLWDDTEEEEEEREMRGLADTPAVREWKEKRLAEWETIKAREAIVELIKTTKSLREWAEMVIAEMKATKEVI